jgi:hypothetical protein
MGGNFMSIEKEETIVGTVGTIGTVAGIGVAAVGTSAATMTGGLATVGAVVGGGMAAGIVITAAAPLAVGAIAFGATKGIKRLLRGY